MGSPVLVTGAGIISAIGNCKSEVLSSLQQGRSGISRPKYIDAGGLDVPCGEVRMTDAELKSALGIDETELMPRTSLLGIHALREAMEQAGISRGMLSDIPLVSNYCGRHGEVRASFQRVSGVRASQRIFFSA